MKRGFKPLFYPQANNCPARENKSNRSPKNQSYAKIMKRKDEFEMELDKLLSKYSDLSYSDIADSLDYYCAEYTRKAEKED